MHIPDTPLFVKTHDFNVCLLNHTMRFPKHFRYTLTQRLEILALEFEELLLMGNAVRGAERRRLLVQADGTLACLRVRLRYALDFQLLSGGQIRFASECLNELGSLLGAWLKGTDR